MYLIFIREILLIVTHDLDSLASVTKKKLKRDKLILRLNNLDDQFKIFKFQRKFNLSSLRLRIVSSFSPRQSKNNDIIVKMKYVKVYCNYIHITLLTKYLFDIFIIR